MKMPEGWGKTPVKAKKITARVDMSDDVAGKGLCPVCKHPMKQMIANNQPVLCCMADRVVLPIKTV